MHFLGYGLDGVDVKGVANRQDPGFDLRVGVVGASGFVGVAVSRSLLETGWDVTAVRAPRVPRLNPQLLRRGSPPSGFQDMAHSLATELKGCEVVVNAAGDSRASSNDEAALLAANAVLPNVIREACEYAEVRRLIHVSSAAVQGDLDVLDSSVTYQPNSLYARSKALGEKWLLNCQSERPQIVIYRPPGVHAPGRAVTEVIRHLSSRGFLPVAGDGSAPTPQASLENVADAIRFLAGSSSEPPNIVHHPWEGLSCEEFLVAMGGRDPWHLPYPIADAILRLVLAGEKVWPRVAPHRRRLQLLFFGQRVTESWLSEAGWMPTEWS